MSAMTKDEAQGEKLVRVAGVGFESPSTCNSNNNNKIATQSPLAPRLNVGNDPYLRRPILWQKGRCMKDMSRWESLGSPISACK